MNSTELSSSLRRVVSALHKGLRKQTSSTNSYSMTELETIRHLIHNTSLLPSELAVFTRVKTQSMSQILNKLESHGVILRTPSKKDKRKVSISLTAFGKEMVEKTRYVKDEWLRDLIDKTCTVDEIELLGRALPVLQKLIEIKK